MVAKHVTLARLVQPKLQKFSMRVTLLGIVMLSRSEKNSNDPLSLAYIIPKLSFRSQCDCMFLVHRTYRSLKSIFMSSYWSEED